MAQSGAIYHGSSSEITHMDAVLYKGAEHGDINVLKSSSADLQLQLTPRKNTVLHIAAQFGQAGFIERILELPSCLSLLLQRNLKGDTPLQVAAREGHLKAVKALIRAAKACPEETEGGVEADKAMLRMTNKEGDTALHEAVRFRHPKVVKLLIEEDGSLTTVANSCGETPLYIAAAFGFRELVKIIVDDTSKWNISPAHTGIRGSTALHAAVFGNSKDIVKEMLQWKPDLAKEVDEKGWSPLHCAAYLGRTSIVKELLEKCEKSVVYLGVKTDDNKTALHIAASRGHLDIVKLLVSHSPDCFEQVDDRGNNALHLLIPATNFPQTLRLFSGRGLLNEKNDQGQTPVHLLDHFFQPLDIPFLRAFISWPLIFCGEKIPLRSLLRSAEARYPWQKIAEGDEISSSSERKERDEEISDIKKASKSHLIVAALIATVTFTAAFTLPGGYVPSGEENEGMAVLAAIGRHNITLDENSKLPNCGRGPFGAFILADVLALVSSLMAVHIYFLMAISRNKHILRKLFSHANFLTFFSICMTMFAFFAALSAVLGTSGIVVKAMFIMMALLLMVPLMMLRFFPLSVNFPVPSHRGTYYFMGCIMAFIAWFTFDI